MTLKLFIVKNAVLNDFMKIGFRKKSWLFRKASDLKKMSKIT